MENHAIHFARLLGGEAIYLTLSEAFTHFKGVKKQGDGYVCLCPAHNDHNPSLSIGLSDDGNWILLHCFAGCTTEAILSAAGLKKSNLYRGPKDEKPAKLHEIVYRYCDAGGTLLYTKTRVDYADGTKKCYFQQPNGTKGVKGLGRVPYNLPAVCKADKVYFVEGEKCAQAITEQGCVATTLDSGAKSKWLPEYGQHFDGRQVIIIPDNDKPGMEYALKIARSIPHAIIKQLPGLKEKEDIFDWLAAGHTMEEVDALPEYKPLDDSKRDESPAERSTQAETLMELCDKRSLKPFLNEANDPYAAVPVDDHTEVFAMDSRDFSLWLQHLYYQETKRPIRAESLSQVVSILSANAKFSNKKSIRLFNRVALHDGAFWYDLTNPAWQTVKVTADGWEVNGSPSILFNRYRHQNEQVLPQHNGDISKIFQYVNVKEFRTLFLSWLVSCFVPEIPHPMPIIFGEKGAAKSTACVLLKRLIDPSALDTLTLNNDQRTLVVNLQQHYVLPFDNVSAINGDTSDMLCRAITGGSVQQRKLCTNAEDYIFTFMRCLMINGVSNVANRSDLLDRSLLLELERVPETERKELSEVYRAFEEDRASILGGIFDTLTTAMALFPTVKLDRLPRMADFAKWGYAVAEALGGHGEQFLREYAANYERQNTEAIESDPVATLTIDFMRGRGQWSGRVSALLVELEELAQRHGISKNAKSMPTQPNALSRRLNGMRSNLKAVGITFVKEPKSDGSYITLTNENTSSLPSYRVDSGAIMGLKYGDVNGGISTPGQLPPYENPLNGGANDGAGGNGDNSEGSEEDDVEF